MVVFSAKPSRVSEVASELVVDDMKMGSIRDEVVEAYKTNPSADELEGVTGKAVQFTVIELS